MTSLGGFPQTNSIGKMHIGTDEHIEFKKDDIIIWENTAGKSGMYQWFGWQDKVFANQGLRISFWIKFVGQVPSPSWNFGVKIYGAVYNDWVR